MSMAIPSRPQIRTATNGNNSPAGTGEGNNTIMRHTTLKQLRFLSAVIKTGTVTAASSAMNVTPPAITAQVKALEDLVGMPLVERVGDRFIPTSAGAEIASTLARIEALLNECGSALAELKEAGSGRVSIGVVSTAKYFAPMALAAFRKERPKVDINFFVGNRDETILALKNYEVDLAIMGRPPAEFDVESKAIGGHPQVMIASPSHPLAAKRDIDPRDLLDEIFLVREAGSGTRNSFNALMSEYTGGRELREFEMGSNETIKQAVIAGLGISFISSHTIAPEVEAGRLVILDVVGLPIMKTWFVVRRTDKRLLPAAEALHAFWLKRGAEFLPKITGKVT
jgi:LysR family transcriptional regulator, low CO2-responsive transcriptional regulator